MANMFKTKIAKCLMFFILMVFILCFTFVLGRYSWRIEKRQLFGEKEEFWVDEAVKCANKSGIVSERPASFKIRQAVKICLKNKDDEKYIDVTFDEVTGDLITYSINGF